MSFRSDFKRSIVGATPSTLNRLERVSKLRTVHLPPSPPYANIPGETSRETYPEVLNMRAFEGPYEGDVDSLPNADQLAEVLVTSQSVKTSTANQLMMSGARAAGARFMGAARGGNEPLVTLFSPEQFMREVSAALDMKRNKYWAPPPAPTFNAERIRGVFRSGSVRDLSDLIRDLYQWSAVLAKHDGSRNWPSTQDLMMGSRGSGTAAAYWGMTTVPGGILSVAFTPLLYDDDGRILKSDHKPALIMAAKYMDRAQMMGHSLYHEFDKSIRATPVEAAMPVQRATATPSPAPTDGTMRLVRRRR